jgi:hypothetical protein
MAHFYGSVQGARGEATRLGHKSSGMRTVAASWSGSVTTELYHRDGVDYARVRLLPWNNMGVERTLYDGPVGGAKTREELCHDPILDSHLWR